MKAEPEYFCIPSQNYLAVVWMRPIQAQTTCGALRMFYLADTSFSFSFLLLFFCSFLQESDGTAVVSDSIEVHTASLASVCVHLQMTLKLKMLDGVRHCLCGVHACVCRSMFLPILHYVTQCLENPHPPPLLLPRCCNLHWTETFFAVLEAVIGVMRSGWGNS